MIAEPTDSFCQCSGIIRWNDKPGYAVLDYFRHTGNASTNHRRTARHAFKQGLSEQFWNTSLFSIHGSIYARQNNAEGTAIGVDQLVVVTVVAKDYLLSISNLSKRIEISVVEYLSNQ